jgi:hypothetical protein
VPRRLVPVAKAPLFRHPIVGPLLRLVDAIPSTGGRTRAARRTPSATRRCFPRRPGRYAAGAPSSSFPRA